MQPPRTSEKEAAKTPAPAGEIIVLPFHDAGHVFPVTELAGLLASRGYLITLLLPSTSSFPASSLHPLIRVVHFKHHRGPALPFPPPGTAHEDQAHKLLAQLVRTRTAASPPLLAVVVDVMMGHLLALCRELCVPAACLFTASACSAALEHARSCRDFHASGPVSGLPAEMALIEADLTHHGPHGPPIDPAHHCGPPRLPFGPENARRRDRPPPPWSVWAEMDGAIVLLFNTCDDLERLFLDYIAKEVKKPAWAVGPLLPAQFWLATAGSLVHDDAVRPNRTSSHTERDVLEWLNSKPPHSVIYVCFGSIVSLNETVSAELAAGLEESNRVFIWAIPHNAMSHDRATFSPNKLADSVGERGLVIRGWAPQLLILSHPSIGGFVTHCGWNSTVEALALGVPMLTWPIHGDQMYNARLVTKLLRVGHEIRSNGQEAVTRNEVAKGIEQLMTDKETKDRAAAAARDVFGRGFPQSSSVSLDAFLDLIDPTRNDHHSDNA